MHFYLHIPFCRQKCPYCKFALTPIFNEAKKKRYIAHLKNEILSSLWKSKTRRGEELPTTKEEETEDFSGRNLPPYGHPLYKEGLSTIYFWWGTPSVLSLDEVQDILNCFPDIGKDTEISFECNPEDITSEYIGWLLWLGINRLSIWVQSLNNETLKAIHRSDRESILDALSCITDTVTHTHTHTQRSQNNNFEGGENSTALSSVCVSVSQLPSLNIDFIIGLPFSKSWETLDWIKALHQAFPFMTHTSVYMLEDGHYPASWKQNSMNEEQIEREYSEVCEYFVSIGWHHYEISNWSKPGYECRHNQWYWDHSEYQGFGLSATSYSDSTRSEKSTSFAGYYRGEKSYEDILDDGAIALEKIIFGIRTFSLLEEDFDREILKELNGQWYIEIPNGKIVLTPTWIFRENTIIRRLIV